MNLILVMILYRLPEQHCDSSMTTVAPWKCERSAESADWNSRNSSIIPCQGSRISSPSLRVCVHSSSPSRLPSATGFSVTSGSILVLEMIMEKGSIASGWRGLLYIMSILCLRIDAGDLPAQLIAQRRALHQPLQIVVPFSNSALGNHSAGNSIRNTAEDWASNVEPIVIVDERFIWKMVKSRILIASFFKESKT